MEKNWGRGILVEYKNEITEIISKIIKINITDQSIGIIWGIKEYYLRNKIIILNWQFNVIKLTNSFH